MKHRIWSFLIVGAMLLSLTACGQKSGTEEPPAASEPAQSAMVEEPALPEPEPEPTLPEYANPLTGMEMDEAALNNRPVAVMLNNLKAAQPQLGVSMADIIYEVPAEGGITRMLAVYQSLDSVGTLGSIRSARAYYLELALGHDALLVHAGGSPEAYQDIPAWGVDNMDGVNGGSDAAIFWRDPVRRKSAGYEHSLLTSGEKIQEYLAKGRYRTEHKEGYSYPAVFALDGTPADGETAQHVTVKFSPYKTGTFDYDAESGKYQIGQYGKEYVDGNTGRQVGVTNLLILQTAISRISGDSYGRLSVKLTGSGEGTFFCGGKSVPIEWSKASRNDPFVYRTKDGQTLMLGQGSSYVCIISPRDSTVTVE